jgi:hemerythrin-like domain-containing protein
MGIAQTKNLLRRLAVLEQEAVEAINRACGHEIWQSVGFDALDSIEDADRRARANYYYGQLQVVRELQDAVA